jgi:hypothetical protein
MSPDRHRTKPPTAKEKTRARAGREARRREAGRAGKAGEAGARQEARQASKQKKQKESKAIELGDALSDQLSDCTQNSSIPMTEKITFETFEWEQS